MTNDDDTEIDWMANQYLLGKGGHLAAIFAALEHQGRLDEVLARVQRCRATPPAAEPTAAVDAARREG